MAKRNNRSRSMPRRAETRSTPGGRTDRPSRERAEAARIRIAEAQRRRRLLLVGSSVLGIVAIVAALVIVKIASGAGQPKSGTQATAAQSAVLQAVAGVPASVLDTIGVGTAQTGPVKITAPVLTSSGKPRVLYIGAEYCPYCAAERWAVAVALSRFGTLHGVGETASSPSDVFPSTATLSFHGTTYTSTVLSLTAKELQSNQVVNGQYAPLDTLNAADQAIAQKYNAPPYVSSSGSIPFVDIGGTYVISGANYDPGVLQGKTHAQIARALSDPASPVARAVDGSANLITAAICTSTGQQPAAVCTSAGVRAAAAKIGAGG